MNRDTIDQKAVELAIGRIFGMLQRPYREGDAEEYERCRAIVMAAGEARATPDTRPNWARDRLKGAAGD